MKLPETTVLPCGCVMRCTVEDGVNVVTIVPCRQTCTNLRYAVDLAGAKGKPISTREAP